MWELRILRKVVAGCLLAALVACSAEDPDPCDPDCPPTNCGETDQECG